MPARSTSSRRAAGGSTRSRSSSSKRSPAKRNGNRRPARKQPARGGLLRVVGGAWLISGW